MAQQLSYPLFAAITDSGVPAAGYLVYTYAAGTSTPLATYPTAADASAGTNANTNPVVLDAYGRAAIWLTGVAYKIVLHTDTDIPVWSMDNVTGATAGSSSSASEWVAYAATPTYISATSFSVANDQTAVFTVGRRIQSQNTAGVRYSTITAASFGSGITTVTVTNDSGSLDSGLSAVSYGVLNSTHQSAPIFPAQPAYTNVAATMGTSANLSNGVEFTLFQNSTEFADALAEFNNTTGLFTALHAGSYQVMATCQFEEVTALTFSSRPEMYLKVNGSIVFESSLATRAYSGNAFFPNMTVSAPVTLAAGGTIACDCGAGFSGGSLRVAGAQLFIQRIA